VPTDLTSNWGREGEREKKGGALQQLYSDKRKKKKKHEPLQYISPFSAAWFRKEGKKGGRGRKSRARVRSNLDEGKEKEGTPGASRWGGEEGRKRCRFVAAPGSEKEKRRGERAAVRAKYHTCHARWGRKEKTGGGGAGSYGNTGRRKNLVYDILVGGVGGGEQFAVAIHANRKEGKGWTKRHSPTAGVGKEKRKKKGDSRIDKLGERGEERTQGCGANIFQLSQIGTGKKGIRKRRGGTVASLKIPIGEEGGGGGKEGTL